MRILNILRYGESGRGLTHTFLGTLFLILLCKVNTAVEFENQIFVQICNENYTYLTLLRMFISEEKPNKYMPVQLFLKWQQKII